MVREYRARWKAVREVEIEEQRHSSITVRWQQLNPFFALARGLGLSDQTRKDEIETVRQRWVRKFAEVFEMPELWKEIENLLNLD